MSNKKNFLDDINGTKPESFQEEVFIRQRKNLVPSIIVASAILVSAIVLVLVFSRGFAVPEMEGWKVSDAEQWAEGKNIQMVVKDEYSLSHEAGEVMDVQPDAGTKVKRQDTVTVSVSRGADPNESIDFPDLKNMNLGQLNKWIDDNRLPGITVRKENSSVFEVDSVINYEMVDGSETTFVRKNRVRVYVSLGPSILDETVNVPGFSDVDKTQVLKWANENEITVEFLEQFSEYIEYGRVVGQSIEAYTKMNRTDVLVITMSLGRALRVPDFTGMSRNEASETAAGIGIQLQYRNEVSKKTEGTVLGQDFEPGSEIHGKQMVTLTLASESEFVSVPNLTGLTSMEASGLAGIHNISIFIMNRESTRPEGTVISQSAAPGSEIATDEVLYLYVSTGNATVPDFSSMSRQSADLWAMENGVSITYIDMYSDSLSAGSLFGQNYPEGMLPKDGRLVVYHSLGRIPVGDFTGMTKLDVINWQQEINSKGGSVALKFHVLEVPGMSENRVVDQTYRNEQIGLWARLDVWITDDSSVTAPDFTGLKETDFTAWCEQNSVSFRIDRIYSDEYTKGILFGQNFTGNSIPEGAVFVIKVSAGKPWVPLFRGYNEVEVRGWVNGINLAGAELKLTLIYEQSPSVPKGTVIRQDKADKSLSIGEEIRVWISLGSGQ